MEKIAMFCRKYCVVNNDYMHLHKTYLWVYGLKLVCIAIK